MMKERVDPTCSIAGCDGPVMAKSMCVMHYKRVRKNGSPHRNCATCGKDLGRLGGAKKYCSDECRPKCSIDWCENQIHGASEYCNTHHKMKLKHGAPVTERSRTRESESYDCMTCGETFPPNGLSRKFCSDRCQAYYSRHKGVLPPMIVECSRCGYEIDRSGPRFTRSDISLCDRCRKSRSLRHKVSVNEIAARDGTECKLCGEDVDMNLIFPDMQSPSIDHIVPYSKGGSHNLENLQLAHFRCNAIKQARENLY